jgi:hypothetical protein
MIADAAGFKTIEEASRVLSRSNAEAEAAAKSSAERADQQELLNKAIERAIPVEEKIQLLMANFAITMGPVVDVVTDFLSLVLEMIDKFGPLKYILTAMVAGFVGFLILSKIGILIEGLGVTLGLLAPAAAPAGPALVGAGAGVASFGASVVAAAPGLAIFAGTLFIIAAGIALVALSMGVLYVGLSKLILSFIEMFKVLANTDGIAGSLASLGASMGMIAFIFTNPIVILGLVAFSIALNDIVSTLNDLDEKKSFNFAAITKNIAELNVKTTTTPNNIVTQTGNLVKAINEFKLSDSSTANLERILKAAIPQNNTPNVSNTYSPQIIVKINDRTLKPSSVDIRDSVATDFSGTP